MEGAPPRRVGLLLEYQGTAYGGSQYQKNAPTIQARLEAAISSLTRESIRVALAGRTDAGVHAWGQVASFLTRSRHSLETFLRGLNHYLPEDIAVRAVVELPRSFDVRRRARSRCYRYLIFNGGWPSALWRHLAWPVREPLNAQAMAEAAQCLLGEHDFAAFTQPAWAKKGNTRRHVLRAEVKRRGHLVSFDVEANAFLPQQVRRTVAALVQVGSGRLVVGQFGDLVRLALPGAASLVAPPHGLYLLKVRYDTELFGRENEDHQHL